MMNLFTLKKSILALIDYNWNDELHDFQEQQPEDRTGHIFNHLLALDNFMNNRNRTADDYMDKRDVK